MAGRINVAVHIFVCAVLAAAVMQSTEAAEYTVGDTTGWVIPPGGNTTFYSAWAADKTFRVGDVLVFNFATGAHDVAAVSMVDFDDCDDDTPISLITTGPASVTLNATGSYYYICTISSHCEMGQKLAINVTTGSSAPSPTGSGTPTPPPPPSGGVASLAAAFSVVLLSIAIGLLC